MRKCIDFMGIRSACLLITPTIVGKGQSGGLELVPYLTISYTTLFDIIALMSGVRP